MRPFNPVPQTQPHAAASPRTRLPRRPGIATDPPEEVRHD